MNTQELQDKVQRHLSYLEQDKTNVNLLLTISDGYRQLGDWDLAQRYLNEAKTHSGRMHYNEQGLLYMDTNQLLLAKESLTQALLEEESQTHRHHLAYCLYLNRDFEEALLILNQGDSDYQMDSLKAKILIHLQRTDEAFDMLHQLFNQNEFNDELAGFMALLHFDNYNIEQAELFSKKALAINEHNAEGQLVNILLKSLRNEATLAELESMLVTTPNECRLWFALGAIQMQHMNINAAEQAFANATNIWPDFYECWLSAGWCYVYQNKLDQAENSYKQATRINTEGSEGWGGLALVAALRLKIEEAQELLQKTLLLDSGSFLASITQIMITNATDPKLAGKQLHSVFPEIGEEINQLLDQAIAEKDERTLH